MVFFLTGITREFIPLKTQGELVFRPGSFVQICPNFPGKYVHFQALVFLVHLSFLHLVPLPIFVELCRTVSLATSDYYMDNGFRRGRIAGASSRNGP